MPATKHVLRGIRQDGTVAKLGASSCYAEAVARADRVARNEDGDGQPVWFCVDVFHDDGIVYSTLSK